jgi:acyl-CoA reductase-like NAD-dependent aldehyde dehydrogenase
VSENLRRLREEAEKRKEAGLKKAIEVSKLYTGVTGVVLIRDEKGVERWLPKKAYMQMLEAGRKVTLLKELKTTAESQSDLEREVEKARKEEQRVKSLLMTEREKLIYEIMKMIKELLSEEKNTIAKYEALKKASVILDSSEFSLSKYITTYSDEAIKQEKRHITELETMLDTVKEQKFGIKPSWR